MKQRQEDINKYRALLLNKATIKDLMIINIDDETTKQPMSMSLRARTKK